MSSCRYNGEKFAFSNYTTWITNLILSTPMHKENVDKIVNSDLNRSVKINRLREYVYRLVENHLTTKNELIYEYVHYCLNEVSFVELVDSLEA